MVIPAGNWIFVPLFQLDKTADETMKQIESRETIGQLRLGRIFHGSIVEKILWYHVK